MEALHPDISEVVLSEEEIKAIVARMGKQITKDYEGKNPLLVAVLKGAVVFTADVMRAIDCPVAVDFMAVSSYGDGVKSSGVVRIVKDLDTKIEGRDVLIVEDILDSGLTLSYLIRMLEARKAKSVKVAAFLVKEGQEARRRPRGRGRPRARRVHRGLRPRLRRALSQPSLHRDPQA